MYDKNYFCNYDIELFAGMYLQSKNKFYPTILLFRTGCYTLMGGKSFKCIYKSEHFLGCFPIDELTPFPKKVPATLINITASAATTGDL